jgi:hypothetical protein
MRSSSEFLSNGSAIFISLGETRSIDNAEDFLFIHFLCSEQLLVIGKCTALKHGARIVLFTNAEELCCKHQALARACGAVGFKAEKPGELGEAIS